MPFEIVRNDIVNMCVDAVDLSEKLLRYLREEAAGRPISRRGREEASGTDTRMAKARNSCVCGEFRAFCFRETNKK